MSITFSSLVGPSSSGRIAMPRGGSAGPPGRNAPPGGDATAAPLARHDRPEFPFAEAKSPIPTEEGRDLAHPRVSDEVPHQSELGLGRKPRLLARPRGPCRDEFARASELLAH